MRKIIYLLPVILLIISSCAATKTFPKDKRAPQDLPGQEARMKDYNFNYPDSAPEDFDGEFPNDIANQPINVENAKYQIALLLPLTGPSAEIGQALFDSAQMAAFDKGNYDVSVVPYDTKGTGEGAAEAAYEAVQNNASIIVGSLFGTSARKIAPIARTANIKVLTFSNDQTVAGNGVYILGLIPNQQVKEVVKYAERIGIKGISAIIPNDKFGHSVKDIIKDYSKNSPITYRGDEVYSVNYPRYSNAASKMISKYRSQGIKLSAESEAVFIPQGGEALERILLGMQQKGLGQADITILGTALWDNPETLSIPELNNAIYAGVPYEAFENFSNKFMSSFGYRPQKITSLAYDAVDLAIKLSDSNFSTSEITNQQGFIGVNGAYRFDSMGVSERRYEVVEILNGQIRVVERAAYYFD